MIAFSIDPARAQRTIAGALLGGVAGGALVPSLLGPAGPFAARAALGAAIAAGTLLATRGSGLGLRAAAAGAFGLAAAALDVFAPRGLSTALLGLGVGIAVAPEGLLGGPVLALGRAAAPAAGAILGAVAVGLVARSGPFAALTAPAWGALLGGALGLGIGLGEAARTLHASGERLPREVEDARGRLSPELRAVVEPAERSHARVREAVREPRTLEPRDRHEALATARELLLATTRSALAADELGRTLRSLGADAEGARGRVETGFAQRRAEAVARAHESARALAELGLALTERAAPIARPEEDLATRARGLALRLGGNGDDIGDKTGPRAPTHALLRSAGEGDNFPLST